MNNLVYFLSVVQLYFMNINAITLWIFTTFFLYLIQKCNEYFITMNYLHFIIGDFVTPFFIYISMILLVVIFHKEKNKKISILQVFLKSLVKLWWIIIIKLLWNLSNMIIMGGDYYPAHETAGLLPVFVLFIMWGFILLYSMYQVPKTIIDNKLSISLSLFIGYLSDVWQKLLFCLITSFLGGGFVLIILCFLLSSVPFYLASHCDPIIIKVTIEDVLALATQIFTGHIIALISFHIYLYTSGRNNKKIKLFSIE
jgi:hypothetical protein